MYYREYADTEEKSMQLLKNPSVLPPPPTQMPNPIVPPGLPQQRQKYLYDNIREFCAQDGRQDVTCPRPTTPEPVNDSDTELSDEPEEPVVKRGKKK